MVVAFVIGRQCLTMIGQN